MRQIDTVFRKELLDALRDRRSLVAGMAYALVGPIVLAGMVTALARKEQVAVSRQVAIVHSENAPRLVDSLVSQGYSDVADAHVRLIVENAETEALARGRALELTLRADLSEHTQSARALETAIARYEQERVVTALIGRGVASSVVHPVRLELDNTTRTTPRGRALASVLLIFFACVPFVATMAAAADSTAGERERRTLESLLARPTSPIALALGKWLALVVLGCAATLLTVALGMAALARAPLGELGLVIRSDPGGSFVLALGLVPLVLSVSALQLVIGLWAANYKEGNAYLNMLTLAPVTAGLLGVYGGLTHVAWIPIVGDVQNIEAILLDTGETHFLSIAFVHLSVVCVCMVALRARFRAGGGDLGA